MIFLEILFLLDLCVCGEASGITEKFVQKNNNFGIGLYKAVSKEVKDNLVFSPYSTHLILALVHSGARGKTAYQLKSVLGLNTPDEEVEKEFENVMKSTKHVDQIEIRTANKAYISEGVIVDPKFSKLATEYFDSGIENVDFKSSKKTAEYINSWVEKNTNNKIKNLINEKKLNELSRLILVNALYFEGNWKRSFIVKATKEADFFVSKHETVKVPMMETTGHFLVFRNHEMKVTGLMLPYKNPKAQFCMFLPDELDGLPKIEEKAEELWKIRNFTKQYIKLHLPKFRIESNLDMIQALKDIGIDNLFSKADLTGITKEEIFVSSVTQKTYMEVNEHGTSANSGTAGDEDKEIQAVPHEDVMVIKADHPFGFSILYEGISLIVGRFANH